MEDNFKETCRLSLGPDHKLYIYIWDSHIAGESTVKPKEEIDWYRFREDTWHIVGLWDIDDLKKINCKNSNQHYEIEM